MDTLSYIFHYFHLDPHTTSYPITIPKSRWDIGYLVNALGLLKGVEVGVYKAAFTTSLARKAPLAEITGVDAWAAYQGYKDEEENDLDTAQAAAIEKTKPFPNITLLKGWSLDAAKNFADDSLDFVYIDANHDYEHCQEDLAAWVPKVKKGGLVMGHDYVRDLKKNVGVIRAVDEWVKQNQIAHLFAWTDRTPSWMFIK